MIKLPLARLRKSAAFAVFFSLLLQPLAVLQAVESIPTEAHVLEIDIDVNAENSLKPIIVQLSQRKKNTSSDVQACYSALKNGKHKVPGVHVLGAMPELLREIFLVNEYVKRSLQDNDVYNATVQGEMLLAAVHNLRQIKEQLKNSTVATERYTRSVDELYAVIESVLQDIPVELLQQLRQVDPQPCEGTNQIIVRVGTTLDAVQSDVESILSIVAALENSVATTVCCATLEQLDNSILDVLSTLTTEFSGIACQATPITTPTDITVPGSYCLANDIIGTITISANNVSLNLNNYVIDGIGNGLVILGDEFSVANGIVRGMSENGILLQGSYGNISAVDLISNGTGITLSSASGNFVTNCRAITNTGAGFALVNSSDNYFSSCQALSNGGPGNAYGFWSFKGCQNNFEKCVADNTFTTVLNNLNTVAGFVLSGGELRSQIANSTATNTQANLQGLVNGYGIFLDNSGSSLSSVATFIQEAQINANQWLELDGTKYVATAGAAGAGGYEVRVLEFNANAQTLSLLASYSAVDSTMTSLDWTVINGVPYLAVGSSITGGMGEVNVLVFNPALNTLGLAGLATFEHGAAVNGVSWLQSGTTNYVAMGGEVGTGGADTRVLQFDAGAGTLTDLANFTHGGTVDTVDWQQTSSSLQYLAIGGLTGTDGISQIEVLSFDANANTLTSVALYPFGLLGSGAEVRSVEWLFSGTVVYLGVGGVNSLLGNVQVLNFIPAVGLVLVPNALFDHGAQVNSVSWLVGAASAKYLAIGGVAGTGGFQSRVLFFNNLVSVGALTSVADYNDGSTVNSVDWSDPCSKFLALGSTSAPEENVLAFLQPTTGCVVKNNSAYNTHGTGFAGDSTANLFINNLAYNNDTNYSGLITNLFTGGLNGTAGTLQNISLPPL